ncbi:GNAT family N-acetyltransferase [Streptomyces sp. NPDC047097]|uniref:GNAT family N-acetyltransferase n=1 Tax=Streptomyces sp. NPDC047097 TaxID=3155260 RepID=UPI0033DC52FA
MSEVRAENASWQPVLLGAADPNAVTAFRETHDVRYVHDEIEGQLEELLRCREPGRNWAEDELESAKSALCGANGRDGYGTWVWYPWSGRMVRLLPEAEFTEVRTNRNRGKIARRAQEDLRGKSIGIVGLSVGNAIALTLAMEGVGGRFVLADFDVVGLSNLNRLRAGVQDLGLAKSVLCARQMLEVDPYLDLRLLPAGLTDRTFESFFDGPFGTLDLVVEECDTPWVKLAVREEARSRGVPVLMETNDRGMIDIERFDLEPDRPLLHGRLGAMTVDDLTALDRAGQIDAMITMVDPAGLSPAAASCVPRIGVSLASWPQLASGVMLGGATVTDVARRILCGEQLPSGRHYVDLQALVPAEAASAMPPRDDAPSVELTGPDVRLRELRPDDAVVFRRIYTDRVLTRHLGVDTMTTRQADAAFRAALGQRNTSPRNRYTLAMTVPGSDTMQGVIGLLVEDYGSNAMINGLVVLPGAPFAGRSAQAGRLLLAYAFGPLNLHRVWAGHRTDHTLMPPVASQAGLRHEATLRHLFRTRGQWHDVDCYAAIADEWVPTAQLHEAEILAAGKTPAPMCPAHEPAT